MTTNNSIAGFFIVIGMIGIICIVVDMIKNKDTDSYDNWIE